MPHLTKKVLFALKNTPEHTKAKHTTSKHNPSKHKKNKHRPSPARQHVNHIAAQTIINIPTATYPEKRHTPPAGKQHHAGKPCHNPPSTATHPPLQHSVKQPHCHHGNARQAQPDDRATIQQHPTVNYIYTKKINGLGTFFLGRK